MRFVYPRFWRRLSRKFSVAARARDVRELEGHRRFLLLFSVSYIGVGFLYSLALVSYQDGFIWLAQFLGASALVGTANVAWLHYSRHYRFARRVVAFGILLLCVVLLVSGGRQNTGFLWIYPLLAVGVFIAGFWAACFTTSVFMLFAAVLLLTPDNQLLMASYSEEVKHRFLITSCLLSVLCLAYEYSHLLNRRKLKRLTRALAESANTDSLTKLKNRRYIEEKIIPDDRFNPEFATGGVVILCDIDNFKRFNDSYGHEVGDTVLQSLSALLKHSVRAEDKVARWGGEEFLVLMPRLSLDKARERAEECRKLIEWQMDTDQPEDARISMSFGLSRIDYTASAAAAIKKADVALYAAKEAGRNRVVVDDS